jgi:broad specificity phosphatase PhoE/ribonuclease HI
VSVRRLIVEADGGSRGNPGPAAYGALVRDAESGELLAEVGEAIGVATNNVAEYRGVIAGLAAANRIDPTAHVEARLDSKLIVEQMSGRWKIKNADLKPLAVDARRAFPADRVSYTWVPREQNTHADRLVNEALDGDPTFFSSEPASDRPGSNGPTSTPAAASASTIAPSGAATTARPPILGLPAEHTATTLLLVRHGRTAGTVARHFSGGGVPGPPLDDVGRDQAKRIADMLAGCGAAAVIASPMVRTQQTAAAIATRIGRPVTTDSGWRECEFGEWEGAVIDDVVANSPAEIGAWRASTAVAAPGGESLDQMTKRVVAARDQALARYPGQTVVVVTHSLPIRALIAVTLDAPLPAIHQIRPAVGSLTDLRVEPDGSAVLAGFNIASWPTY